MMKRYSAIIWAIAALLLASCTHDLVPEFEQEEGFVLSLMPSGMDIQTKATPNSDPTRPGNWDGQGFHENDLGSQVDLFFFRNGAGFDTPSVYNVKANVNQRGVVSLPVSPALITTIFGSNIQGSKAKVMVGGACLTQDYADSAGADAYAKDGVAAVKLAEKLIEK